MGNRKNLLAASPMGNRKNLLAASPEIPAKPESWEMRCGFRTIASVTCGLFPCFFVLFVLPAYPLYVGDIKIPGTLLSNIMAAGATYQSIYILGFGIPQLVMTYLMAQAGELFKARGVAKSIVNFFLLSIVGAGVGLFVLLAFCFESEIPTLETAVHSTMHNLGTVVYFGGAAAAAWVYRGYLQPELERLGAIHPADATWCRRIGSQLVVATIAAGVIRCLHLYVIPFAAAIPMLIIECYTIFLAISIAVLGHLRLYMHMDAVDPIVDMSFISGKSSAKSSGKSKSG